MSRRTALLLAAFTAWSLAWTFPWLASRALGVAGVLLVLAGCVLWALVVSASGDPYIDLARRDRQKDVKR